MAVYPKGLFTLNLFSMQLGESHTLYSKPVLSYRGQLNRYSLFTTRLLSLYSQYASREWYLPHLDIDDAKISKKIDICKFYNKKFIGIKELFIVEGTPSPLVFLLDLNF